VSPLCHMPCHVLQLASLSQRPGQAVCGRLPASQWAYLVCGLCSFGVWSKALITLVVQPMHAIDVLNTDCSVLCWLGGSMGVIYFS
jgi:uncharacterized membrane protein YdcZ (DUF606 family)